VVICEVCGPNLLRGWGKPFFKESLQSHMKRAKRSKREGLGPQRTLEYSVTTLRGNLLIQARTNPDKEISNFLLNFEHFAFTVFDYKYLCYLLLRHQLIMLIK